MDPISICHVLAAGEYGGLESVAELLTTGLADQRHRVSVVLLLNSDTSSHAFEDALRAHGLEVHAIRSGARAYWTEQRELREQLRQIAPDIVHGHGYQADIQLAFAAPALGLPAVSTLHGFTGGGLKIRVYEALHLRSLRRFARLAAVSAPIAERLRQSGVSPDRVEVVQNAWAPTHSLLSRNDAREDLGLPEEAKVIGWVGRLSFEKAADLLIEALALIDDAAVMACVIGDGGELAALRAESQRLGVEDRVRFVGRRAAAGRYFSAFDVYALSSRTEGTPMVLFEAAAASVPIVTTRVGGIPDVFGEDEAFFVEPEDPAALAAAITEALGAGREGRVERARTCVAERFAVEPWVARYESFYRGTIESAKSGSLS